MYEPIPPLVPACPSDCCAMILLGGGAFFRHEFAFVKPPSLPSFLPPSAGIVMRPTATAPNIPHRLRRGPCRIFSRVFPSVSVADTDEAFFFTDAFSGKFRWEGGNQQLTSLLFRIRVFIETNEAFNA